MRFFITLMLFIGSILRINAMSMDNQELIAVSIYKNAYSIGLVSQRAMNYVQNMTRCSFFENSALDTNPNLFSKNHIRIDIHHLFSKALIKSWKKAVNQGQYHNNYMNFLLNNKISMNDIDVLYQILNKHDSNYDWSENQTIVIKDLYPILNRFTSDEDYERDMMYISTYVRDPNDIVMFCEIIAKNIASFGLDRMFYNISKKRFAQIDEPNMGNLLRKKEYLINEYQERSIRENWLRELYSDAITSGVISPEEWNQTLCNPGKIGINPVRIVILAAIKMVTSDFRLYNFLKKYGIQDYSIVQMMPVIRSFIIPEIKMVNYLNNFGSVLGTISRDLARIGIIDGAYYISKESVISSLQQN
jgi:hypothetical protein